jgi:hypothetical protein
MGQQIVETATLEVWADEQQELRDEVKRLRAALATIEAHGCDLRRYNNVKAFPVVSGLGKRLTNMASVALGRGLAFPEPEFAPRGQVSEDAER